MKRSPFLRSVLAVLGVVALSVAGCHQAPQTPPDRPRLDPGVAMQDVTFLSAALNRQMTYRVFLPAKIPPGRKLPVVYLLHGQGDTFITWSNNTDVARYAAPENSSGLILVMPGCGDSYYMNSATKPEDKYEDYLTHDLIADVESRFPAATGRENRAIIGVSMGGFAAVKLALSHPDLYVFAGSLSGAIDVPSRRFTFRRAGQWWRFRGIFGSQQSATRRGSDPFLLVQTADPHRTPYLCLTAGEQEALLEPNRRFASHLNARRFRYEFHTLPGGHDWIEWNSQIPGCFESLLHRISPSH